MAGELTGEDVAQQFSTRDLEGHGQSDGIAAHDGQVLPQQVDGSANVGLGRGADDIQMVTFPHVVRGSGRRFRSANQHRVVGLRQREGRIRQRGPAESFHQACPVPAVLLGQTVKLGRFERRAEQASVTVDGPPALGTVRRWIIVGRSTPGSHARSLRPAPDVWLRSL